MMNERKQMLRVYLLPLFLFFIPTLFFTFPIIFNFQDSVYGPLFGTDTRGTLWQMWWSVYSFKNGLPYSFHSIVAAPFGNDVSGFPQGFFWSLIIGQLTGHPSSVNRPSTYYFWSQFH